MTDLELANAIIEEYSRYTEYHNLAEYRLACAYLKQKQEIEDYKALLRIVYKCPINPDMVTAILKKWEAK